MRLIRGVVAGACLGAALWLGTTYLGAFLAEVK